MKRFLNGIVLLVCMLSSTMVNAQNDVEMADQFRADGKIYVVVAVVLIVLFGLVIFLWSTDRKLKKLEEEIKG